MSDRDDDRSVWWVLIVIVAMIATMAIGVGSEIRDLQHRIAILEQRR